MSTGYEITTIDQQRDEEHYIETTYPRPMPDPEGSTKAGFDRAWSPGELQMQDGWECVITTENEKQVAGTLESVERDTDGHIKTYYIIIDYATNDVGTSDLFFDG